MAATFEIACDVSWNALLSSLHMASSAPDMMRLDPVCSPSLHRTVVKFMITSNDNWQLLVHAQISDAELRPEAYNNASCKQAL